MIDTRRLSAEFMADFADTQVVVRLGDLHAQQGFTTELIMVLMEVYPMVLKVAQDEPENEKALELTQLIEEVLEIVAP